MEKKHPPKIEQRFFWNPPGTDNKTLLPIYEIKWGNDRSAVKMLIFGPTKELMELAINDVSFSRRPRLAVTNAAELMSIPDPQPRKLTTPKEREQIK